MRFAVIVSADLSSLPLWKDGRWGLPVDPVLEDVGGRSRR